MGFWNTGGCLRAAAAATVALACSTAAFGADVVGGWEGSSGRGYTFVQPSVTLHTVDQLSWILRGSLSYLYYDFPDAGGTMTQVRSPGASIGIAMRYAAPGFTVTVGPGYEARQTRRLAAGSETTVQERGLTLDGNVFAQVAPRTMVSLLASYGAANKYHWARAGVKQQISGFGADVTAWHVGGEATVQGNQDVKSRQLGGVIEAAFARGAGSLQLRAGYSHRTNPDGSNKSEPYLGIGAYRAF